MEQQKLFDLPSGGKLAVTVSEFANAAALMKATLKSLKGIGLRKEDLDLDVKPGASIGDALRKNPAVLTSLLERVVDFATSPEVEAAFWSCAAKALYIPPGSDPAFPGERVTKAIFDDVKHGMEAREDYAAIMRYVVEVNCGPFFKSALSGLLGSQGRAPASEGRR